MRLWSYRYRVTREDGQILYDGKISFCGTGPFRVGPSIIVGPFVNLVSHNSAAISFTTNVRIAAAIEIVGKRISGPPSQHHEIVLSSYKVIVADYQEKYSFTTAPPPGIRHHFCFAYASDSHAGQGGGDYPGATATKPGD